MLTTPSRGVLASVLVTSALFAPLALGVQPAVSPAPAKTPAAVTLPTDEQIRDILVQRIDKEHRAVGIVVGIVTPEGTRIVSYGKAKGDGPVAKGFQGTEAALTRPLDGDTVFEIGSITKTFTASILADMALKGEVSVEDPLAKYLPADVKVPRKGDKDITLRLLAQHMSGLPRMPGNFKPKDETNVYADYDAKLAYEWLATLQPARAPGEDMEYSNIGYGLLGHALCLKTGKGYEALMKERITGPLGMSDTVIVLPPALKARLAHGHGEKVEPVGNWDLDVMQGAGAIRSTVKDLLQYAAPQAGIVDSPLHESFAMAQELKYPWRKGEEALGSLGWASPSITPDGQRKIWWHNGGTGGYHSFLGFDKELKIGVVVLSNCTLDIDDIAQHILVPSVPVDVLRTFVTLPREALDKVVGVYEVGPNSYRTITRYRDRLFLQRTGQLRREFKAESPTTFYNPEMKSSLTFETGENSKATRVVLRAVGIESPAKRVDVPPQGKTLVEQDPATFDGLAGTYPETPDFVFTVRREGERLLMAVTAQGEFELFPLGKDRFTALPVDCEFQFDRGADGRATSVTRYQNGAVVKSARTK